ncbi:unnamed protein product [Ambrosiozyma monospora]|uniref:Unnamed protein product n=1 Tax=Ambrosiozyma monospora TaxID=43982 RepID=A0A9W7DGJ7_AMBMO|nr:unnamed protein product [Ambrosiozyma monospora]
MKYSFTLSALTLAASAFAAYVPSEPWSTLTPDATYSCGYTDYTSSFGIAIQAVSTSSSAKAKRDVLTQIGDGQIQAATVTSESLTTKSTSTSKALASDVASQINDGQLQASAAATVSATATASASSSSSSSCPTGDLSLSVSSCYADGDLAITLEDGVLKDAKGRLGAIVANRQFQFDGPPPQAGSIYAGGWSITPEGNLALGDSDIFYQCLSGNFYNLYDEDIADQCTEVQLQVVELDKDC